MKDKIDKPLTKEDRCFLIFYNGSLVSGGHQVGFMSTVISNGGFPNANEVVKWLKEQNPNTIDFVITNLIEVSKADYKTWIS